MNGAVPTDAQGPLAAHVEVCGECHAARLPVERIAMLLSGAAVSVDSTVLSGRILPRLKREVRSNRPVAYAAVLRRLLRALLPLPVVAAFDAYILWLTYSYGATILPSAVVAFWVCSYAAVLVLLFALTYAALPLLAVGQPFGHARLRREQ